MHTRTLLVASLSLLANAAIAQTQYAWVGTYNPNGEGLYRFTVDPHTGALSDKMLVSTLPVAHSSQAGPTVGAGKSVVSVIAESGWGTLAC